MTITPSLALSALATFLLLASASGGGDVAAQSSSTYLQNARTLFDALDYEAAVVKLDNVIRELDELRKQDPANRAILAEALQLRARAQFGLKKDPATRADLESLFQVDPGAAVAPDSGDFGAVFDNVKRATVGEVALSISPPDAAFELNGVRMAIPAGPIALLKGQHEIVVNRAGHKPHKQTIRVPPGERLEIPIELERVSAVLTITTEPSNVEVFVNNASRGATKPGVPTETARARASEPLEITDLQRGTVNLEFRRPCYLPHQTTLRIERLEDYEIPIVAMKPAEGHISVSSEPDGATVFVDGENRGNAPLELAICEGHHTVELRSTVGRAVHRLELRAGRRELVRGVVRPAIALLPGAGKAEDRGQEWESRRELEARIGEARGVTFYAPSAKDIEAAMADVGALPGWLHVNRDGRFVGHAASLTASERIDFATRLAMVLDVQGVATVNRAPNAAEGLTVAILAPGSGVPDILTLSLESATGEDAVKLDAMPPLFSKTVGVLVIDVIDHHGAIISEVLKGSGAAAAGLMPGDIITAVGEGLVDAPGAFNRLLHQQPFGQPVIIHVRRGTDVRKVQLPLERVPALMSEKDRTVHFNLLLVQLRARASMNSTPEERTLIDLHSAVALMRGGNWRAALGSLERVNLPSGPGVSKGTVLYLMGLCREGLSERTQAAELWRAAAMEKDSRITPEGRLITDLVEEKLQKSRQ